MAIVFKIKCSTPEEREKVQERFHNALIGSPAYILSEIAICDGDASTSKQPKPDSFYLAFGLESRKGSQFDVKIDVDSDSFYYTNAEDAKRNNGSAKVHGEAPISIVFSGFTDSNSKFDADNEINKVFCNLTNNYPEFHFTSSADIRKRPVYNTTGDDSSVLYYNVVMAVSGTVPIDNLDEFIKLSHHGEGLYTGTKLQNVHIEVLANGKWY